VEIKTLITTTGAAVAIQEDLRLVEEMTMTRTITNRMLDMKRIGLETRGKDSMVEDSQIAPEVEDNGLIILSLEH
jgi:hypothetical protein